MLRHFGDGDGSTRVLLERDEWFGVLAETFGLSLDDVRPAAKDILWQARRRRPPRLGGRGHAGRAREGVREQASSDKMG